MEMAEGKITAAGKSGQLLEKIWHLNLLARDVLLKSDLDNEGIAEYVLRLISLTKELSRSLSQQLENVTESLQDTCHLLSALHDKHKELTANPEYNGIIDCLQKVKDYLINTVSHLQEAESKLYAPSCRQDDDSQIQTAQNTSRETDMCCSEGESTESVQASSSPRQQSQRTPSLNKVESQTVNQIRPTETKTVEKDIIASLAEKVSAREQDISKESPIKKEGGEHRLLMNSVTQNKDCNGKDKPHVGSSVTEKSPELSFQDALTSSGEDILSGTLKDTYDRTVMNLFEQEKKAVVKESSKGVQSEEHRLAEQMEDSEMETNHEICRNDLITFPSSAQTCDLTAVNPSMNDSEEVQKSRHWINKEFLVEENGKNECEVACFIKAPATALENLKCKIVNDSSSLVVDDSEELVSNVISIECSDYEKAIPFPINIAIPFTSCFRGNYREIMVKVTDVNFQSDYLTPISLEGYHGKHKENFAEVEIFQLGIFSVLSCLKKETFTVPKVGLSQKLNVDSRISFYYPPETFSSPAPMQLKVQPIEPSLVSTLKTRHDTYHSVVSTSALIYVQHPSAQPFNSSVTITLPCPPNPEKKRQGGETEHARAISATVKRVAMAYHSRAMSASVRKNGENISDTLKLLGHRNKEEGWKVFDDVIIQNARNGLVSFDLNEHLESFVVIRLSFLLENTYILLFAQALEEALCSVMANVILYRKRENPHKIVVLLSASKELTWELQKLHEEGYSGPPEPTQQFPLREGEQIHFRFRGNIFASENGKDFGKVYKLIFHSQRKPRLELQIKEVDEFGNHSSPHYKGTAVFYKITREMITKKWEQSLPYGEYEHQSPLCKLALTLPKHEKLINRPQSTKRISSDSSEALWDNLLYWLAEELAEDNTSLLALRLPVQRSILQLVRLKCPDNLTHQIYELLSCWKKTLPRSADKQQLLSRYLRKSGRSDLSEELRFKWQNKVFA
ncbi:PREDICTED: death domain-containing protein 1 [Charadrius vociferus]|uniref:death domain-containing protein 1 n=1 Tax=Charadrius vociferus TaxID=50402 RepID=UPI00052194BA|nr:PREDICTED: death domain-containing protein 1 [Charadrius vociferus]